VDESLIELRLLVRERIAMRKSVSCSILLHSVSYARRLRKSQSYQFCALQSYSSSPWSVRGPHKDAGAEESSGYSYGGGGAGLDLDGEETGGSCQSDFIGGDICI